jgi:leader peptidase (prepilin peptidase) / N-methyltransferase
MPDLLIFAILAGSFGLLFGSFLNVCIFRVPRDLSVVAPRSFCTACEHQIPWYDNIPLVSYLVLAGRCRACKQRISYRYPIVEATTAILFFLTVLQFDFTLAALKWMIFESLMIVLFWTDAELLLLPDEFTLGGMLAGLIISVFVPMPGEVMAFAAPNLSVPLRSVVASALGAIVLALPFGAFAFGYSRLRKLLDRARGRGDVEGQDLMPGLGDIKLLGTLGAFLGIEIGFVALLIGSSAGAVLGLLYIFLTRKDPRTYHLPFGTFLCGAAMLVVFFGPKIVAFWWGLGR